MDEQRFEELMRTAAPSFREPPPAPMDEMWDRIEREHYGTTSRRNPWQRWYGPVIGMAASLAIGFGLGRSTGPTPEPGAPVTATATTLASGPESSSDIAGPYRAVTSRYLGQAVALLVALPSSSEYEPDNKLVERAGDL